MSYGLSIRVVSDDAGPALERLRYYLAREECREAIGKGIARQIQDHLFAWSDSHPNRMGGKRKNIIAKAGKATRFETTDKGVLVTISNEAIAARYFGAEIRPVNAKFLTIPARTEAYGKSARDFKLKAVFPRGREQSPAVGWLVAVEDYLRPLKSGKRKGTLVKARKAEAGTVGGGGVFFWLVKRATIKPEPEILPDDEALGEAGIKEVTRGVDAKWKGEK